VQLDEQVRRLKEVKNGRPSDEAGRGR